MNEQEKSQQDSESPPLLSKWPGDVLNRKPFAEFLTRSLTAQTISNAAQGVGLTVSLDAGWGLGKTFFVKNWAKDLIEQGHPVVVFDAWENDIGDEAAIALMAVIRQELDTWKSKLPAKKAIRTNLKTATTDALTGFRKAILPTVKVITKGVIKKTTGIAMDEILTAVASDDDDDLTEKTIESATEILDSGLDKLLEKILDEHTQRSGAIKKFRESTTKIIEIIASHANAKLPVFVFVDEADRCRPTYAIKLLEEIKHIFGISTFCYVVSTNTDQLRESIKAVYGAGFDSHNYLKRFFDQQFTLPDPDHESFSEILISKTSIIRKRKLDLGLPRQDDDTKEPPAKAVSIVFKAFALDLRSQNQVIQMADIAASALPEKNTIHLMWLVFLCTLNHKNPSYFLKIVNSELEQHDFKIICKEILVKNVEIEFDNLRQDPYGKPRKSSTTLIEVLAGYYQWSKMDVKEAKKISLDVNLYDYPSGNIHAIVDETRGLIVNRPYPSPLAQYGDLVRFAGMRK